MRGALLLLLAACGRIAFDARLAGDAGGDVTGAGDGSADAAGPQWSHLVAYADQTCALFGTDAYCWGTIGIDAQMTMTAALPHKYAETGATAIGPGEAFACVVAAGQLHCHGQTPGVLTLYNAETVTDVSGGRGFACLVGTDIKCWGQNSAGQLGVGDTNMRTQPTSTGLASSYTQLRCGDDHACAYGPAGPVCWGHNDNGTLGVGNTGLAQSPTPVAVTGGITSLPIIAGWHACALTGGNAYCWGRGGEGELGNGGTADSSSPLQITAATYVATGGGPTDFDATCVIDTHPMCWGAGAFGRLGNGVAGDSSSPVDVIGLPSSAVALAIGYDHACALLGDGDIWCWGRGDSGQLGDGLMTNSLSPVKVVKP